MDPCFWFKIKVTIIMFIKYQIIFDSLSSHNIYERA